MSMPADVYRRIGEVTPNGLWVLDTEGRTLFTNPRTRELLGRSEAELLGVEGRTLLFDVQRTDFDRHLRAMAADTDQYADDERLFVLPDGSTTWLFVTSRTIRGDDGEPMLVHWLNPLSDRDGFDQEVLYQRAELAEAQSIARIASWRLDPFTGEVTWSEEMYNVTGWP